MNLNKVDLKGRKLYVCLKGDFYRFYQAHRQAVGNTHGYAFCPWETTDESYDTSTLVATQSGTPLSRGGQEQDCGMRLEDSKVRKRCGIFTYKVSQVCNKLERIWQARLYDLLDGTSGIHAWHH